MTPKLPSKTLPWPICWEGVELIATAEGCRLTAYQDCIGVWTIGWGETLNIKEGDVWTQKEADASLCRRLTEFTLQVKTKLTREASPLQLAAMVSLAYNIGINAFSRSSALKLHNKGLYREAADAIKLWNKAGGKVVAGLVSRRERERKMYLDGSSLAQPLTVVEGSSPDADENCERPLALSTTMRSGAGAAGAGLAIAAETTNQLATVHSSVSTFPLWLILALALAATVFGCVVCWRLYSRKQKGKS